MTTTQTTNRVAVRLAGMSTDELHRLVEFAGYFSHNAEQVARSEWVRSLAVEELARRRSAGGMAA